MQQAKHPTHQRVAVVGGGWAGLAAAVNCVELGQQVSLFEASRQWGGRGRALEGPHSGLDNGQHILIGAYRSSLNLMERVGVAPQTVLRSMPLSLRFADGGGLAVPNWATHWPAPFNILAAIVTAGGWSWADRFALLRTASGWQRQGFDCPAHLTVSDLCQVLPARVVEEWADPLCLSALNTPPSTASAAVFLRVLQDAMLGSGWGPWQAADLLLPTAPLSDLLPSAAVRWLEERGAQVREGRRILHLRQPSSPPPDQAWELDGQVFDRVILACTATEAARLCAGAAAPTLHPKTLAALENWAQQARSLRYESIATVYARGPNTLSTAQGHPTSMLALRDGPAQFVFDRGQLGGAPGLMAFVVSANQHSLRELEHLVIAQAEQALGWKHLPIVKTVIEKRATFACTPDLARPPCQIAPGLLAAGDYVAGPYPATLEGAVRSGENAAQLSV
ncbi:MAG: hypothetical protein RI959_1614 [Pseudomonadota bacterium]